MTLSLAAPAFAYWGTTSTVVTGAGIGVYLDGEHQIAADGNWAYAVWTDSARVIHFSRSSDNGATWAEPASFSGLSGSTYRNNAWSPSIAAADGRVYIVWNRANNAVDQQYGGTIYAWTATANGGTSAANPVSLYSNNTNADRYWTDATAVDEAGTPRACAFYRQNGTGIRVRVAATGGTTWAGAVTVLSNAAGAAGFGRVAAASPLGVALLWKPAASAGVLNVSTNGGTSWSGGTAGWALPVSSAVQSIYATATSGAVGVQRAYVASTGVYVQRWTGTTTWTTAVKVSDPAYDARTTGSASLTGSGTRMLAAWSYSGAPAVPMFSRMSSDGGATWRTVQALPPAAGAYGLNGAGGGIDDHILYSSATAPAGLSHLSWTVDSTPPGVPDGLAADSVTSTGARLTWSASTDPTPGSGLSYYEVYRDGSRIATTSATTCQVSGLSPATAYGFQVTAVDGDGNASARSASVNVTTLAFGISMTLLTTGTVDFGSVDLGSAYVGSVKPRVQISSDKPWDYSSTQTSITAGAQSFPFSAFLVDTGTEAFGVGKPSGVVVDTRTMTLDLTGSSAYDIPSNTTVLASVVYTAVQQP
jgi:chitodextrinase